MKTITLTDAQARSLIAVLKLADKTQNGVALVFEQEMRVLENILRLPVEELKRLAEEDRYLPGLEEQHIQWCEYCELTEAVCNNQIRFGEIAQLLNEAPRFEYVASK
ncbi:hypothetical protein [Aeromonas media]|uniref:hypothetical protein n=1 Tax=Aeromonas media TaxID=651 RepID=UPI0022826403|nr:hypothetical protein [Aeromonas media]MCY9822472.1 hypothetical protein [Aeromonas media]